MNIVARERLFTQGRKMLIASLRKHLAAGAPEPLEIYFLLVHRSSSAEYRELLAAADGKDAGNGFAWGHGRRSHASDAVQALPADQIGCVLRVGGETRTFGVPLEEVAPERGGGR